MADAGRKRLPTPLKVLDSSGRPNKDTRGKRERGRLPDPPEHLGDIARQFWLDVGSVLSEMGVGTAGDRWSLESMAVLYAHYREAADHVAEHGVTIWHPKKETWVKNPSLTTVQQNIKELRMQFNECGLTPSARAKLMPDGDSSDDNPFRQLRNA